MAELSQTLTLQLGQLQTQRERYANAPVESFAGEYSPSGEYIGRNPAALKAATVAYYERQIQQLKNQLEERKAYEQTPAYQTEQRGFAEQELAKESAAKGYDVRELGDIKQQALTSTTYSIPINFGSTLPPQFFVQRPQAVKYKLVTETTSPKITLVYNRKYNIPNVNPEPNKAYSNAGKQFIEKKETYPMISAREARPYEELEAFGTENIKNNLAYVGFIGGIKTIQKTGYGISELIKNPVETTFKTVTETPAFIETTGRALASRNIYDITEGLSNVGSVALTKKLFESGIKTGASVKDYIREIKYKDFVQSVKQTTTPVGVSESKFLFEQKPKYSTEQLIYSEQIASRGRAAVSNIQGGKFVNVEFKVNAPIDLSTTTAKPLFESKGIARIEQQPAIKPPVPQNKLTQFVDKGVLSEKSLFEPTAIKEPSTVPYLRLLDYARQVKPRESPTFTEPLTFNYAKASADFGFGSVDVLTGKAKPKASSALIGSELSEAQKAKPLFTFGEKPKANLVLNEAGIQKQLTKTKQPAYLKPFTKLKDQPTTETPIKYSVKNYDGAYIEATGAGLITSKEIMNLRGSTLNYSSGFQGTQLKAEVRNERRLRELFEPRTRFKTKTDMAFISKPFSIQQAKLINQQKQQQEQKTKFAVYVPYQTTTVTNFSPPRPPTTTEKITPFEEPPRKPPAEDKLTSRLKRKLGRGFIALSKRKGKWFALNQTPVPFGEALAKAQSFVTGTLAASFKVVQAGVTQEREGPATSLSNQFRPSKRDANVFVQKRGYRLGSQMERKEIQQARRRLI